MSPAFHKVRFTVTASKGNCGCWSGGQPGNCGRKKKKCAVLQLLIFKIRKYRHEPPLQIQTEVYRMREPGLIGLACRCVSSSVNMS